MLKENILKALSENRDTSLSGQALAERFGVTRAAVWKAIRALEAEGVEIEAATNRGYRLSDKTLTVYDIHLPSDITVRHYASIDSTNSEAKRLLAAGLTGNAFVFAEEQSAGRGRQGKSFYSPKGTGLYFSYIFHPQKTLSDAVFITTAAAVSVVRAIEHVSSLRPQIKWVNDVYLGQKKLCGILTEAVSDFESGTLESVIVGVGINVSTEAFPPELEVIATSLPTQTVTKKALLQALAEELIRVSKDLENPAILEDYRAHSLVIGKEITFTRGGESRKGKAFAIDEKGALLVAAENGTERLSSGEVSIKF